MIHTLHRFCYFTSISTNRKQDFMRELNISYRSACLQCSLTDKEISEYIQKNIPIKAAVAHVGRQNDGTWVLGDNSCISRDGEVLSIEESRFVWIGDMYKGVGVASPSLQCNIQLPLTTCQLNLLLETLRGSLQHNFIPCLLVMAGRYCTYHLFPSLKQCVINCG